MLRRQERSEGLAAIPRLALVRDACAVGEVVGGRRGPEQRLVFVAVAQRVNGLECHQPSQVSVAAMSHGVILDRVGVSGVQAELCV